MWRRVEKGEERVEQTQWCREGNLGVASRASLAPTCCATGMCCVDVSGKQSDALLAAHTNFHKSVAVSCQHSTAAPAPQLDHSPPHACQCHRVSFVKAAGCSLRLNCHHTPSP